MKSKQLFSDFLYSLNFHDEIFWRSNDQEVGFGTLFAMYWVKSNLTLAEHIIFLFANL